MVLLWQAIEDGLSRTPKMSQNVNATQGFKVAYPNAVSPRPAYTALPGGAIGIEMLTA